MEWVDLNDSGMFLGTNVSNNVKVYKKLLDPGFYRMDDTAAFYLFEFKGINKNKL